MIVLVSLICISDPVQRVPDAIGEVESSSTLTKPLYDFSGNLLLTLNNQDAKSNIIFSPVSIHQALSMGLLGSNRGSKTRQELLNAIGYGNLSDTQIDQCRRSYSSVMADFVRLTNARSSRSPAIDMFTMMITKNGGRLKPEYENDIKRYFNSPISSIGDQKPETKTNLMRKINEWGKRASFEGLVMEKGYIDDDSEALLIAAIQVKAFWFAEFCETNYLDEFYNFGLKDKPVKGTFLHNCD